MNFSTCQVQGYPTGLHQDNPSDRTMTCGQRSDGLRKRNNDKRFLNSSGTKGCAKGFRMNFSTCQVQGYLTGLQQDNPSGRTMICGQRPGGLKNKKLINAFSSSLVYCCVKGFRIHFSTCQVQGYLTGLQQENPSGRTKVCGWRPGGLRKRNIDEHFRNSSGIRLCEKVFGCISQPVRYKAT